MPLETEELSHESSEQRVESTTKGVNPKSPLLAADDNRVTQITTVIEPTVDHAEQLHPLRHHALESDEIRNQVPAKYWNHDLPACNTMLRVHFRCRDS